MGDASEIKPMRLRIIIVGAGLDGLAAAVGLAEHHDVTVFEATKELITVTHWCLGWRRPAGFSSEHPHPPNMGYRRLIEAYWGYDVVADVDEIVKKISRS